jgi:hypothetical protein
MKEDDINQLFTGGEPLATSVIENIRAQVVTSLAPVRPLPSNAVLWSIGLGVFALLSFVVAKVVGMFAIAVLSGRQMFVYYGVVLVLAGLFSRALVEQMIPGSKRFIHSSFLSLVALSALTLLALGIFKNLGTERFVSEGVPCLRLGVIGALLGGVAGWKLLQRGYLVSPRQTIALYGLFAGLVGVTALALHCPILNSMHVLVWHLSPMALAGLTGFFVGRYAN